MKFRASLTALALLLATFSPYVVAQDASAPADTTKAADTQVKNDDKAAESAKAADNKDKKEDKKKKEKDEKKKVKSGSKDDVEAIGNRGLGNRGAGNWYSLEREIKMGREYAQMVESSAKMVQDPVVNEYVNRIGQNIVRNSDAQVPFTIKVVDSDEVNAFALPGGFFYVNSGLILAADEEAELAGVMAHEIAHVAARHGTRQMTRSQWANIGTLPLIFIGGGLGYAVRTAAGFGLPMAFMQFSRGFESEADYLGVQYLYKSGYDPQSYVSFFEKIQAKEKKKPGSLSKAFSTHPQTPDRIEKTQEEISKILPEKDNYIISTSEFDDVKSRLAALENRRRVDDKDDNRPSLRRASSSDDKTKQGEEKKEDDRPTLKRRDQ